jgi:glycosyltransferase involved in cell wall biosynthesis
MRISVVVPVYNEEQNLSEFYLQGKKALGNFEDYEIIFVDDGSNDNSWSIIEDLIEREEIKHTRAIKFTRNFGHQEAVIAGLKLAKFELIGIIDADLQDPPSLLPLMCNLIKNDVEIVYGKRISRDGETLFKKFSAMIFYRLFRLVTTFDIPVDTGDFRVATKRVTDQVIALNEQTPFLRGIFAFTGYKSLPYEYSRSERFRGKGNYDLGKMIKLASNAIFAFSDIPYKLFIRLGLLTLLLSIGFGSYAIITAIVSGYSSGWLSTFTLVLFLGSLNICFTGLIGKFVIQSLNSARARPIYFIDKII